MTVTAVLGSELGLEEQVLWAKRFAESRNEPLLLVRTVRKKGAPQTGVEIDQEDALAATRAQGGEVAGEDALPRPPLAARDAEHASGFRARFLDTSRQAQEAAIRTKPA